MPTITAEHNMTGEELSKALAALADAEEISEELVKAIQRKSDCDDTPKEPRQPALRTVYHQFTHEIYKALADVNNAIGEITAVPLHKATGTTFSPTPEQIRRIAEYINDRFGYLAAQFQTVDYQPTPEQLERWKLMGLVKYDVTPTTFATTIPMEMHFIRNAFIMGRLYEALEAGQTFEEIMQAAATLPLLKPDLEAIAIAEQQTAMYLTDNAADLATKVGQIAIKQRNETIRKMAVDFHARKLKPIVHDEAKKQALGKTTEYQPISTWQQFKSELHDTMEDKARDWDRVAYYEITDAQKQGQAAALMEDGDVDKLVYKRPLPTACPQCKHAYLEADEKTPRIFKLSELVSNGTNIGRKSHPTKGGKVVPGGRPDGQEALKPVCGLMHPWCQCQGVFPLTGFEAWLPADSPYRRRTQHQ